MDWVSRAAGAAAVAHAVFLSYVGACLATGAPVPPLAWTYVWALGLAAMALLGASRWVHEHQWGVIVAGLLGGAGTIGGLMSQFPLVRSVAGFALTVAYWTGAERWHAYGPAMEVAEVKRRSVLLSLAMLMMNAVSYLFLHA